MNYSFYEQFWKMFSFFIVICLKEIISFSHHLTRPTTSPHENQTVCLSFSARCNGQNPIWHIERKCKSIWRLWRMSRCNTTERSIQWQILFSTYPNYRARPFAAIKTNTQTFAFTRCICKWLRWRKYRSISFYFAWILFRNTASCAESMRIYCACWASTAIASLWAIWIIVR